MVMPDATTVLLELCQRAVNLANINSTRTVEYLSVSRGHETHGFRELAINFLEVCQTLWPIQAGLLEATQRDERLPVDVSKELTEKVGSTIEDFNSFDLLLSKLLSYERKKGFSKFFGLMNVDNEVLKLSTSMAKDRDTLRMGSLAFKWILGDANLPSEMGSAYTSLASALKRANGGRLPQATSQPQPRPLQRQSTEKSSIKTPQRLSPEIDGADLPHLPPLPDLQGTTLEPSMFQQTSRTTRSPPTSYSGRIPTGSSTTITHRPAQVQPPLPSPRALSPPSAHRQLHSPSLDRSFSANMQDSSDESRRDTMSDTASQTTVESLMQIEDMLKSYEYERKPKAYQPRVSSRYLEEDTPASRTQTSNRNARAIPDTALRSTILAAVQQKNHQVLEELLDRHIPPNLVAELELVHLAVLNNDCGSLRLLLLNGADANSADHDGITPLVAATEMSLLEPARVLLKYGAEPNLHCAQKAASPLSMSITHDKVEFLELYLGHSRTDVDALQADGETLLVKAINKGASVELVSLMLRSGADVNRKTKHGKTPLLESLFDKRLDIATVLLDHGANPNLAGPKHPLWPATHEVALLDLMLSRGSKPKMAPGIMELATSMNDMESVQLLLKHKVDPNIKKDGVYTPLCSAIRDDREELVSLLLRNGANPNIPASEYPAFKCISHNRLHLLPQVVKAGADLHSPKGILEVAVAQNNKEAFKYLLDAGVDINARNGQAEGATALTTAIRASNEEFVDILLSHGASPAVRGTDWPLVMSLRNPTIMKKILPALPKGYHAKGIIEAAVAANQLESIKMLVAAGFSVEDKTGGVFSPLTSALRERHIEIVRYLLDEANADINAPGEHLPIVKALRRCRGSEDTEAIEILLERGADVNLIYRGWSGLMQAIETANADILRLLVGKSRTGIDLGAKDEEGNTIMDQVRERGWDEGEMILSGKDA